VGSALRGWAIHRAGRDSRPQTRRYEIRRLQAVSSDRLDFPHAAQAIRVTRRVRDQKTKKWRTVTVYAITSLTAIQTGPAELAGYIRGQWQIEALHHI
jgi:hypothetical protein